MVHHSTLYSFCMKKMVRLILRTFVAPPRTLDCKLAASVHLVLQLARLKARVLRDVERLREASEPPALGLDPSPFTMYGAVQRWSVVGKKVPSCATCKLDFTSKTVSLTTKLQKLTQTRGLSKSGTRRV